MDNEATHTSPDTVVSQAQPNVLFTFLDNWVKACSPRLLKRKAGSIGEVEFHWIGIEYNPSSCLNEGEQLNRSYRWMDESSMFACELGAGLANELLMLVTNIPSPSIRSHLSRLELGIIECQINELLGALECDVNLARSRNVGLNRSMLFKVNIKVKIRDTFSVVCLYFSEHSLVEFVGTPSLQNIYAHTKLPVKVELARTCLPRDDFRNLMRGDAIVYDGAPGFHAGGSLPALMSIPGFDFSIQITEEGAISLNGFLKDNICNSSGFGNVPGIENIPQSYGGNNQIPLALVVGSISLSPVDLLELLKGNPVACCEGSFSQVVYVQTPGIVPIPVDIKSYNGCLAAVLKR